MPPGAQVRTPPQARAPWGSFKPHGAQVRAPSYTCASPLGVHAPLPGVCGPSQGMPPPSVRAPPPKCACPPPKRTRPLLQACVCIPPTRARPLSVVRVPSQLFVPPLSHARPLVAIRALTSPVCAS
jgi:hypothetical protein